MTAWAERLPPRTLNLLLYGGLALVVAALFSAILAPQMRAYRSAAEARATLPADNADGDRLAAELKARDEAVASLARRLHGDLAGLPPRQIESYVVDRLQRLAWTHEVDLNSVRPAGGETIDQFEELQFRVVLEGRYAPMYTWLAGLREELGFIVIKDYHMRRADEAARDPRLAVNLTIAAYRRTSP